MGGWSQWSPFSECDAKCGPGKERRARTCIQLSRRASTCPGDAEEERDCQIKQCQGRMNLLYALARINILNIESLNLNHKVWVFVCDGSLNKSGVVTVNHETAYPCARLIEND